MFLYEGSSAYRAAEDARFGDSDDENSIILEKCIVEAEDEICGYLPEDVDFEVIKAGLKKLYEAFVEAYTEKYYWKFHAKHYGYVLW